MSTPRDTFDTARNAAAAGIIAAGAAAILGTMLDWVTIKPPPIIPVDQAPRAEPFTGWETSHGLPIVIAAGLVILFGLLLFLRRRSIYAWGAFLASMVVGGIAIANYRGVDSLFYGEMDGIGKATPALGLTLVAAAGIVGVIAAAAGVSATPSSRNDSRKPAEEAAEP